MNVAFYMQVYKDYPLAVWCLTNLRKHFPDSRVVVISDGDEDRRYERLTTKFGVEYTKGERLYLREHGGRMLHRMFEHLVAQPADYYFKIDTDTHIHRPFQELPDADFFGTWVSDIPREQNVLQGGCTGFSRKAAEKLVRSKVFLSDELLEPSTSWALRVPQPRCPRESKVHTFLVSAVDKLGMIRQDWLLGYCCRMQGIMGAEYTEVLSQQRQAVKNDDLRYAITHPCMDKYDDVDPNFVEDMVGFVEQSRRKFLRSFIQV